MTEFARTANDHIIEFLRIAGGSPEQYLEVSKVEFSEITVPVRRSRSYRPDDIALRC